MITEQDMTLAVDMRGTEQVAGLLASEKLNGCRAYWDGRQFWTRGGNVIAAPKWFTKGLPKVALDGEIWCGRGVGMGNANSGFKTASNAVRLGGHWFDVPEIEFAVFDLPQHGGRWLERLAEARRAVDNAACASVVAVTPIADIQHFVRYLADLRRVNAEGAMFRPADVCGYECGRTANLLRFKFDAD